MSDEVTTKEAATIVGCSAATIRKKLTPIRVERRHVYGRGESFVYLYSRSDAEKLRDGQPIPERSHPDPEAKDALSSRSSAAAAVRHVGREVVTWVLELAISIPADTPTCCQRHAVNHVRHAGTDWERVLDFRQDGKGFSPADAGYADAKASINGRISAALAATGALPALTDCIPARSPRG